MPGMLPGRHRRTAAALALAVAGGLWASCGDSNLGGPGGGGVGNPEFTSCPNISVSDAPATGAAVTYKLVETGGTPPVTTTCSPASGATFPVGTTGVSCTAHDNIGRSAVCSFTVTVASSARLGAMHFLAFGDSTTAGENGIDFAGDTYPETYNPPTCGTTSLQSADRTIQYFDPTASYPQQLLNLLKGRFPGESFVMENEGNPGEPAGNGVPRLGACFATDRPDVLLLLEGVNDIAGTYGWTPTANDAQTIFNYLKNDVASAISSGVSFIFVSTILPVANCMPFDPPQPCRGAASGDSADLLNKNAAIDQVNTKIRAGIGGATIVDGNAAFKAADPTLASLIDVDGLHPTKAGYAVLAQAWMTAVASKVPITSIRGGRVSFPQFSPKRGQASRRNH